MLTKYRIEWDGPLSGRHIVFTNRRETATALFLLLNDNDKYEPNVRMYARKGRGVWRIVEAM